MATLKKIAIQSRAKLNLFLMVLGKRPDGYHNIASVFQTIDLADELSFRVENGQPGIQIRSNNPDLPVGDDNLIARAYRKLAQIKEPDPGVGIICNVVKNIPMGSGMGGGSSNCASALIALNELLGTELDIRALMEIGAELGSDVPFFFHGGTGFIHGRGEIFEMIAPLTKGGFLIITPDVNISTKEAYALLDSSRESQTPTSELTGKPIGIDMPESHAHSEIEDSFYTFDLQDQLSSAIATDSFETFMHNDFETIILEKYPEIKRVKTEITKLNPATCMTGSGSAIFSYFREFNDIWAKLENYEPREGEKISVARPVPEGFVINV